MNCLRDVIYRLRAGHSDRAIARDTRLSRLTVRKYREFAQTQGYLAPEAPLPEVQTLNVVLGEAPSPPRSPSTVLPYKEVVEGLLEQGVEMMAIFNRLHDDHSYKGSYSSVRRFVHQLQPSAPEAYVRVHSGPGEEAQVDFGSAGSFLDPASGRLRQAYVFVMTLSFSRHQYAELVFDQKVSTWLELHKRAFESFGGVVAKVVPDNLKAAVLVASLHDPVLGEPYRRFAQHYGFVISPTRPGTPRHKGKVESGVHYVKRNFLAGQEFSDIREANERLGAWVRERAGVRIHGTTHQAPLELFEREEKDKLLSLPSEAFELSETRIVKVHSDCHVTIDGSYYSAPFGLVGKELDAYIFERVVQLYRGVELVATHPRSTAKGQWHTRFEHYPVHKAAYLERTPRYCRVLAARVGPAALEVVEHLLSDGSLERLRSVQAILRLGESVGEERLEGACKRAAYFGDMRYRRVKEILNAALDREALPDASGERVVSSSFVFARAMEEFFEVEEIRC